MILKGSQRGGGMQLAAHLTRLDENDHVEVHDVRGFVSSDLTGALMEAYAVSRGTKCRQFLFSLSLSPPSAENVPVPVFESAIEEIEKRLVSYRSGSFARRCHPDPHRASDMSASW